MDIAAVSDIEYNLLQKSPENEIDWSTYWKGYSPQYWLTFLGSTILLSAIVSEPLSNKRLNKFESLNRGLAFVGKACINMETLSALRNSRIHCCHQIRVLGITVVLFGSLNFWCYNATLVSNLAVFKAEQSIQSFQELLARGGDKKLYVVEGHSVIDDLKDSPVTTNRDIWDSFLRYQKDSLLKTENQLLDLVLQSRNHLGLLTPDVIGSSKQVCQVSLAKETYFTKPYGVPVRRQSEYLRLFKQAAFQIARSGIYDRHLIQTQRRNIECQEENRSESPFVKSIDYETVKSIFVLLATGIATASSILLLENVACLWTRA